jgi:hypothetical protein
MKIKSVYAYAFLTPEYSHLYSSPSGGLGNCIKKPGGAAGEEILMYSCYYNISRSID